MPLWDSCNAVLTYVNHLTKYCRLIQCFMGGKALSASSDAKIFFENMVKFFGVPAEVINERDLSFTALF